MSTQSIRTLFARQTAQSQPLTEKQAKALIQEAQKDGVTADEAALIADLGQRAVVPAADSFTAEPAAKALLVDFGTAASTPVALAPALADAYAKVGRESFVNGTGTRLTSPPDVGTAVGAASYVGDIDITVFEVGGTLYRNDKSFGPFGMESAWFEIGPAPVLSAAELTAPRPGFDLFNTQQDDYFDRLRSHQERNITNR